MEFLHRMQVDARKPSGRAPSPPSKRGERNPGGDAMAGAFFGAFGPGGVATANHLRNQERSLEMAKEANEWSRYNSELNQYNEELGKWESWKQWALDHQEWPDFLDLVESQYEEQSKRAEEHNQLVEKWYYSQEGQSEIRSILLAEKKEERSRIAGRRKSQGGRTKVLILAIFSAVIFWTACLFGISMLLRPSINGSNEDKEKTVESQGTPAELTR
jgi:hypothetical protein